MLDFNKIELDVLKFWEKEKVFDKLRKKNKGGKKWSFIDGPITANNPMGVHHAWGRTYKDVFHRGNGYPVPQHWSLFSGFPRDCTMKSRQESLTKVFLMVPLLSLRQNC